MSQVKPKAATLLISFTVWMLMSYAYLVEEEGIGFWTPLYENIRYLVAFLIIGILVNIYAYYKNKSDRPKISS